MRQKTFFLVYQGGIANVFQVDCLNLSSHGRDAQRVYQGDFHGGINFAIGSGAAGAIVRTAACNKAGDIADATWTEDLDNQPFSDRLVKVDINGHGE